MDAEVGVGTRGQKWFGGGSGHDDHVCGGCGYRD